MTEKKLSPIEALAEKPNLKEPRVIGALLLSKQYFFNTSLIKYR